MAVLSLTESRIRDLPFGSGIWRDEQVKGLLVVCHAATKTYAAQGDVRRNGRHIRTVRVKIDRVDRIGLREARNRARTIMSQIQSGVDPTAKPKETGITILQALDEHLQEKPFRDATIESYRYNVEHYLSRYKNRAVADLSRAEVRDIYQHLRSSKGQPTATGVMRTLRAVINTALRLDETLTSNPVTFLRLPTPRSRQVDELDLAAWWEKTEELSPIRRDLHRAMLLTGARRASKLAVLAGRGERREAGEFHLAGMLKLLHQPRAALAAERVPHQHLHGTLIVGGGVFGLPAESVELPQPRRARVEARALEFGAQPAEGAADDEGLLGGGEVVQVGAQLFPALRHPHIHLVQPL